MLIAFPGSCQRCFSGCLGAVPTAIDVAPVTVAADDDLAVTTSTVIETGGSFHRRLLPMRTGLMGQSDKYLSGSCTARLLVRYRGTVEVDTPATAPSQRLSPSSRFFSCCHSLFLAVSSESLSTAILSVYHCSPIMFGF